MSSIGTGQEDVMGSAALLDAAHIIRPAAAGGADVVGNGIALTPTPHRLFDLGLFTIFSDGGGLRVKTPPLLRPETIAPPDSGYRLPLRDCDPVRTLENAELRPDAAHLEYHRRQVFRYVASGTDLPEDS